MGQKKSREMTKEDEGKGVGGKRSEKKRGVKRENGEESKKGKKVEEA